MKKGPHLPVLIAKVQSVPLKLRRSIDYLLDLPEIDRSLVGVAGLSYGGYHSSMISAALEPRFHFCLCSCGLSIDGPELYPIQANAKLGSMINISELIAMICPRLYDEGKPLEPGREAVRKGAEYYNGLGLGDNFKLIEFPGEHEFHLDNSLAYLQQK